MLIPLSLIVHAVRKIKHNARDIRNAFNATFYTLYTLRYILHTLWCWPGGVYKQTSVEYLLLCLQFCVVYILLSDTQ